MVKKVSLTLELQLNRAYKRVWRIEGIDLMSSQGFIPDKKLFIFRDKIDFCVPNNVLKVQQAKCSTLQESTKYGWKFMFVYFLYTSSPFLLTD